MQDRETSISDLRWRLRRLQRERVSDKAVDAFAGFSASGFVHILILGAIILGLPDFDDHPPLGDPSAAMFVVLEASLVSDATNQISGEEEVVEPKSQAPLPPTPATAQNSDRSDPALQSVESKVTEPQPTADEEATQAPLEETEAASAEQPRTQPEAAADLVELPNFQMLDTTTFAEALPTAPSTPTQETVLASASDPPPVPPQEASALPTPAVPPAELSTSAAQSQLSTATAAGAGALDSAEQTAVASDAVAPQPATTSAAPSARLTADEIAALKSQLRRHWQLPSGTGNLAGLSVKVRIVMNPDRTPREVSVVDLGRYGSDENYRKVADSAVMAVWSAGRSKLILPPEKYDQWSIITVTFDLNERAAASADSYASPSADVGTSSATTVQPSEPAETSQEVVANSDAKLTAGELRAFQSQLKRLWAIPSAFKDSRMTVKVRIAMNPDGSVDRAEIVDQARYQTDSVFRVLADSVLSTIQAASNERFALPAEKFSAWSEITMTFDPQWKS